MPEPIINQFSAILLFILGGLVLGLAFDLLSALRLALRARGLGLFLLDLSFWFLALIIVLPLLVIGTWGDLRFFVWIALFLGFTYYLLFLRVVCRPIVLLAMRALLYCLGLSKMAHKGDKLIRAEPRAIFRGQKRGSQQHIKN